MKMAYKVHSIVKELAARKVKLEGGEEMDVLVAVKSVQFVSAHGHGTLKVAFKQGEFSGKMGDSYEVTLNKVEA